MGGEESKSAVPGAATASATGPACGRNPPGGSGATVVVIPWAAAGAAAISTARAAALDCGRSALNGATADWPVASETRASGESSVADCRDSVARADTSGIWPTVLAASVGFWSVVTVGCSSDRDGAGD